MQEIHVHEIMNMMMASKEVYTQETLKQAVVEKFGAGTTFHSCSKALMSADDAIAFLAAKGKFIPADGGFFTDESKRCSH